MVKGYHNTSFFIVSNHTDTLFYTMMKIAALNFASFISDLHTFASRKKLDLLAGVSDCFWTTCTDDLTIDGQKIHLMTLYLSETACHSWRNRVKEYMMAIHIDISFYSLTLLYSLSPYLYMSRV